MENTPILFEITPILFEITPVLFENTPILFENNGVYEGALTYSSGAYRPTQKSIMTSTDTEFNAPSREAIWYRINKLTQGEGWEGTHEDFVAFYYSLQTKESLSAMVAVLFAIKISPKRFGSLEISSYLCTR